MKTKVEKHFDKIARDYDCYKTKNKFYYDNLKLLLSSLIPKNSNVLEFGCGTGDLLVSLKPKNGVGYDISKEMVKIARSKHKNIFFTTKLPKIKFGYIFMSDVIEHLENLQCEFKKITKLMNSKTKFIITMANPIWETPLMFWERMGWKMKEGPHKRIRYKVIKILSKNSGMKIIEHDYKLLIPIKIPFIANFANKYLEKYLKPLCFVEFFVCQVNHLEK